MPLDSDFLNAHYICMMNLEPTTDQATDLAVTIFRTQAVARPWATFHLVLLDGSFWPPSTDTAVLTAAIQRWGIAGTVGIDKLSDTEGLRVINRWVETPEALCALAKAADALSPTAMMCDGNQISRAVN